MAQIDVYQSITDKIIHQLDRADELGQWKCPWYQTQLGMMPRSAVGRYYKGVNVLVLWCEQMDKNYLNPIWATYRQWKSLNHQVRRGEHGTMICFWKSMDKYNHETGKDEKVLYARAYWVFNIQQLENWEKIPVSVTPTDHLTAQERLIEAEEWFKNIEADVRHGGDRAFYSPTQDFVAVPKFEQFKGESEYYSTLAHEHIHWTGHKSRLDRELQTTRFGNEAYAFEELVAELGAAFVCGALDIDNEPRPDHAKYLNSWLTVLRQDKKAIFTAASKAQKAVEYLVAFQPGGVEEDEATEDC